MRDSTEDRANNGHESRKEGLFSIHASVRL